MLPLRSIYGRIRDKSLGRKFLYQSSLMIFFWALYDGVISYVTPLVITEKGISKTAMGLIYSTSSVAGAVFDFFLSKFLKNTHYRRLFLLMFLVCLGYPFLLFRANTAAVFIFAMAVWGMYYDLVNFGLFDLLSRKSTPEKHSSDFSFIGVFKSLGYFLAPIIAGLAIGSLVGAKPFELAFLFLLIALVFYGWLSYSTKKEQPHPSEKKINRRVNLLVEFHLWRKIGKVLLPVLIFTLLLSLIDAFFWTIGPFYSENFPRFKDFGGLFLAMYTLPTLVFSWSISSVTKKFGKKVTAYFSILISLVFLLTLPFWQNPWSILGIVFISSAAGSLAWPAINGAFVDYITETFKYEREIEGLNDFFVNAGYVLGPILAGFLADKMNEGGAFWALGAIGIIVTTILILTTPKEIKVEVKI